MLRQHPLLEVIMATSLVDEERLKELLKAAIVEVLEERRDLVLDLFEEALEDVALARAMEEGESSGNVSREEVFQVLESGH
jgi:ribosomal protein L12E/L44/L45/RPP1/RPP2